MSSPDGGPGEQCVCSYILISLYTGFKELTIVLMAAALDKTKKPCSSYLKKHQFIHTVKLLEMGVTQLDRTQRARPPLNRYVDCHCALGF